MLGLRRKRHASALDTVPCDRAVYVRSDQVDAVTAAAHLEALRYRKKRSRLPLPPEADYPLSSELIASIPEGPAVLRLSLPGSDSAEELEERAEDCLYELVDDPQQWTLVGILGSRFSSAWGRI